MLDNEKFINGLPSKRFAPPARLIFSALLAASCCVAQLATVGISGGDEFVGPFASWANVKTAYGAVGDGLADDTAALQQAFSNAGNPGYSPVVYLPAGTYRITSTLGIGYPSQGISIIGQDPATTTILWAGPAGEEMLYLNGFTFSKISRLTWNGSGTALAAIDYGWNGTGAYGGSTYVEDSDEVFENLNYGIRGGTLGLEDSEHSILRCKFISITKAGLSVENYNALDWYVWDSTFVNDFVGVTNLYGGGNFHVYGSLFQNSTRADIEIQATSFFSMRQNFSQNSNVFLLVDPVGSSSAAITLQSNTILDAVSSPLQINNVGTVLMFDNVIRGSAGQSGPLVTVKDSFDVPLIPGGLVAIGNTVSQSNWYSVPNGGEVFDINNAVTGRSAINPQAPIMPSALPNYNRRIFEVAAGSTDAGIQHAIDGAVAYNGQRPVVHLPAGSYPITHSVVVPSGSDVQIVGDGGGSSGPTKLQWATAGIGTVVRMPGPSRAALRDFDIYAGNQGLAIQLQNVDQASGRVFMEQMNAQQMTQYGVFINGLDNTSVIMHDGYVVSDNVGIQVTGGPAAATGQPVPARNDLFAGLTASNTLSYNINNHGKLMSQDVWYEGAGAQLVDLTDSGTFTLHGAHIGAQDAGHGGTAQNVPTIETTNFNGLFSLLGAQLSPRNRVSVEGTATNTNVLALGILGPSDNSNFFSDTTSQQAQVAMIDSRQFSPSGGSVPAPDQIVGIASPQAFISAMVSQTRTERAAPLSVLPAGTTDARLYRVSVGGGATGVEVDAGGPGSTTGPVISAINVATNSITAVVTWTTDQVSDTQAVYGPTAAYTTLTALDYSLVTSHSVVFQNLTLGTTYHFALKSRSLSGYVTTSADQSFTTPSASTPTGFIISNSPGAIRGDYTGWVGMEFTVGSAPVTITQLGRIMVGGNKGTHTLKLVAGNGADVPGGSVTISMGGSPGAFQYVSLPSALVLPANMSYFLLSSEVSGGDLFYNVSGVVSSNVGTVLGAVYTDSAGNYLLTATGTLSYGPLDFIFTVTSGSPTSAASVANPTITTAAPTDPTGGTTTTSSSTTTSTATTTTTTAAPTTGTTTTVGSTSLGGTLLSSFTVGTLRSDYTGFVGMEVSVGPAPISVSALGRLYVSGNSAAHILKLVQTDTGIDVPGGAITVTPSLGTLGQFVYAAFASPLTLAANTSYYLVSQETAGSDQWYDVTPVTVTGPAAAGISGPVYFDGANWVLVPYLANQSYVPVNLLYVTLSANVSPAPILSRPVAVARSVNPAVTGDATAASSAATASPAANTVVASAGSASVIGITTVASVQVYVDGTAFGSPITTAPYTVNLDTTLLTNGSHVVTTVATDSVGNTTTSDPVTISVNN